MTSPYPGHRRGRLVSGFTLRGRANRRKYAQNRLAESPIDSLPFALNTTDKPLVLLKKVVVYRQWLSKLFRTKKGIDCLGAAPGKFGAR